MNKYQEALNKLCSRCYVESEECTCHGRYKGGKCYDNCEHKEALQELVYKATPKKVKNNVITTKGLIRFTCPNCNNKIDLWSVSKHCPNCGQALDWSDEDDK